MQLRPSRTFAPISVASDLALEMVARDTLDSDTVMTPTDISQDPDIEFSPLGQMVTRDGLTVRVVIFRVPELDSRWTLEVIDQQETSTVWDEVFETDDDAFTMFQRALEAHGIAGLTETFH